jgi:hypothetical protein
MDQNDTGSGRDQDIGGNEMNINFEDDYLEPIEFDNKNDVTKKTLKTLEKVMLAQDEYGISKYKKALKHTMNYDWLQMFLEEMADGMKYIQNEMDRKKLVIDILEWSLEHGNPKVGIENAISILKTEGTGK